MTLTKNMAVLGLSDNQHKALESVLIHYAQILKDTLMLKYANQYVGKIAYDYVQASLDYCEMLLGHLAQAEAQGKTIH